MSEVETDEARRDRNKVNRETRNGDNEIAPHVFTTRLRALVLALGEIAEPAWWKTEFMSETGLRFLERLYPRTPLRAAINSAGVAAREEHDKAVGRVSVYHLFRLPESLETEIHASATSCDTDFTIRFRACLGQREKLMEMLSGLCDLPATEELVAGPRRIGGESDAAKIEALGIAAGVYFQAFQRGRPAFPYFTRAQSRIDGWI